MHPWNCCRMCLGVQSLNPIHAIPDYNEKYATVVFITTGIKIDIKDSLPQVMCTECINFINESYKFRKKCEQTQKILHNQPLDQHIMYNVKVENNIFKEESNTSIDISDLLSMDNDFKDYHESDLHGFDECGRKEEGTEEEDTFETHIQDSTVKPIEFIFANKKNGKADKPCRKKVMKRDKVDVKQRAREEIECEYCHKILTSKLSLRNHYKIHTGFDVVCEHCGKKFITRRLLLMHCRAKHGYEKTDKCSYCDYRASNAEQVKIHERLHTGEKPYVCKDCNAGFHRKSSYLQHVAIHLPEKTVQCDQCTARFKSVTLMRIHKNRHRAPRYTFRCRVCDNGFARRRNVARHLQRIHGLQPDEEHIDRLKIA